MRPRSLVSLGSDQSPAWGYVEGRAWESSPITEQDVKQIHTILFASLDNFNAGHYRTTRVMIRDSTAVLPAPQYVEPLMAELSEQLQHSDDWDDVISHAAAMHFQLVRIHPFIDGNGRTARLLMNLLLMRASRPPCPFSPYNRGSYIASLETAHAKGTSSPFANFVRQQLTLLQDAPFCYPPTIRPASSDSEEAVMRDNDRRDGNEHSGDGGPTPAGETLTAEPITVVGTPLPPPQIRAWENAFLLDERSRRDGGAVRPSGDRPTGRQAVADRRLDLRLAAQEERYYEDTVRTVINIQEPSDPGSKVLLNAFIEKLYAIQEKTGTSQAVLILLFKGATSTDLTQQGFGLLEVESAFNQLESSVRDGMLEGIARLLDADIQNTNELTASARVYYRSLRVLLSRSEL